MGLACGSKQLLMKPYFFGEFIHARFEEGVVSEYQISKRYQAASRWITVKDTINRFDITTGLIVVVIIYILSAIT